MKIPRQRTVMADQQVVLSVSFLHDADNDPKKGLPGVLDFLVPDVSVVAQVVESLTERQPCQVQVVGVDTGTVMDPAHELQIIFHFTQIVKVLQYLQQF